MNVKDIAAAIMFAAVIMLLLLVYGVRDGEIYEIFRPIFVGAAAVNVAAAAALVFVSCLARRRRS